MLTTFALTRPRCGGFEGFALDWMERERPIRIADLGGGANPMLEAPLIHRRGMDYTVIDISQRELDKAPPGYHTVQADLSSPAFSWDGRERFDLVFSRMLAEHVPDGAQFHRNVRSLLAPHGLAVHCFPTLYSLPFLFNRFFAEPASDWLLNWIQPRDRFRYAKFPAYYSWGRGPSRHQCRRLAGLGYEILEYRGFFGHPDFESLPLLDRIERRLAERLLRRPHPLFTSYAFLALRRAEAFPAAAHAGAVN